jgi:DNA-binding MarR family transcriptional regulator
MNKDLNIELIHSIFQFKKLVSTGFGMDMTEDKSNISMMELLLMDGIADNTAESGGNISLSEIGGYLAVSKGAVSQMLGSLEKKGYINRDVDRNNRRNLIVTLTDKGREALEKQLETFSGKLERIISQLGEDDVRQMIGIVSRMIEIAGNEKGDK